MENFISLFLATLEHLEVVTASEAKKLSQELRSVSIPDNYEAASRMVGEVIKRLEIKTVVAKAPQPKVVDTPKP